MHTQLYLTAVLFGNSQKFDLITELLGKSDVILRDMLDALNEDLFRLRIDAVSYRGEDKQLVPRVISTDIESRIRFGVTKLLRLFENGIVSYTLITHLCKHIVASPVHYPHNRLDMICREPVTKCVDDGNASRDTRLVLECYILRKLGKFVAVIGKQRFVGGYDRFFVFERFGDDFVGFVYTAHKLYDNVDLRIVKHLVHIGCKRYLYISFFVQVSDHPFFDHNSSPRTRRDDILILF